MKRTLLAQVALMALIGGMVLSLTATRLTVAQGGPQIDSLLSMSLEDAELPPSPVLIRLLRITMEPGSSSPGHTHPGPELWRIESGTVTVRTQGPTTLIKNGEEAIEAGPVDREFTLDRGDQIAFPPGTPFTFSNESEEEIKLLVVLVLPQGHQYPPLVVYLDPQPAADAFNGIVPTYLGDGRTDSFPTGRITLTLDRVRAEPGVPLPAQNGPVLLSVVRGSLDMTVAGGLVQVSRSDPTLAGVQPDSPAGTEFNLRRGDAIFFQAGMSEMLHPETVTALDFYRVSVRSEAADATPVAASELGAITLTGPIPEDTPTPEPTSEVAATEAPTEGATETPAGEPTLEPTGTFAVGQTVYVNDTDVRLRDAPTTQSNILTGLTIDQALVITGESVNADEIVWWPVASPEGDSFVGWVAEQFLASEPTA